MKIGHNYFVYITTNKNKKVLYTGVTNDSKKHFAGKYNCFYLVYFEIFQFIEHAILREKEIKGWLRSKKDNLINNFNSEWKFLNDEID